MALEDLRPFGSGVNQSGVRDYNERLLLTMIHRLGPIPGSDLSRQANLSAQTVSVILRSLEADGFLLKGDPQRGRVGKPRVPIMLNPAGTFAIGLKIGRRTAELALMDLLGEVRLQKQIRYTYPAPGAIFEFLKDGVDEMLRYLPASNRSRVCGIGIAAPFELWKKHEGFQIGEDEFRGWQGINVDDEVAKFSDLPVSVINDATSACYAENNFGEGAQFRDYAYFFIGAFIGGGIVMNEAVFEGNRGNAGALGSLINRDENGKPVQLMDRASLFLLEAAIAEAGGDPNLLWEKPDDWSQFEAQLGPWIDAAAHELAQAALSCCSVIDFEAVVIDGAMPATVRKRLVKRVREFAAEIDTLGLFRPEIREGTVGNNARVIGAAYRPIASQYFLGSGNLRFVGS